VIPAADLFETDRQTLRLLVRRDRAALLLHAGAVVAVVVVGEALAFHLGMADRLGFVPLMLRGLVYLLLSTAMWAALLRANRRRVVGLMQERHRSYEAVLFAYDSAIALKDSYTGGHGRRVARYAHLIATAMGLSGAEAEAVREAALLHDLGKIGMPDRILSNPSRLDAADFASVQRHPGAGADILEALPPLRRHAPAVRHHHEHYDGSGYPDALIGLQIPFEARIIAVADAFDAMSSHRSYRRAILPGDALEEIARAAGSQFDPKVVAAATQSPCRDRLCAAWEDMT